MFKMLCSTSKMRAGELWLYYWDERDGQDCCGWWVTPDYVGNNDFFLSCQTPLNAASPCDGAVGAWRSPNVEQLQLKRKIEIGFVKKGDAIVAVGADAGTPIVPDNIVKVDFSKMEWREQGMNHGKPCFVAKECAAPPSPQKAAAGGDDRARSNTLMLVMGVAIGVLAVLAVQRAAS